MNSFKTPRVGVHLSDTVYIPLVKSFVPARVFRTNTYQCIIYKDCESFDSEYQYLYIMFVYRKEDDSTPCFAVSSSTNSFAQKLRREGKSLPGSYTLGVFPCNGETRHLNLVLSDDWADLEKFTEKAISVFQEYLTIVETPTEMPLPEPLKKRITFAKEEQINIPQKKKAWWKFWEK